MSEPGKGEAGGEKMTKGKVQKKKHKKKLTNVSFGLTYIHTP